MMCSQMQGSARPAATADPAMRGRDTKIHKHAPRKTEHESLSLDETRDSSDSLLWWTQLQRTLVLHIRGIRPL